MYRMLVLLVVSLGLVGMAMLGSAQPPPGDPDGKGGPGGFDKELAPAKRAKDFARVECQNRNLRSRDDCKS